MLAVYRKQADVTCFADDLHQRDKVEPVKEDRASQPSRRSCLSGRQLTGIGPLACSGGVTGAPVDVRRGIIFNLLFGNNMWITSQAVVVRRNLDCRKICAVSAVVEYQQTTEST